MCVFARFFCFFAQTDSGAGSSRSNSTTDSATIYDHGFCKPIDFKPKRISPAPPIGKSKTMTVHMNQWVITPVFFLFLDVCVCV